MLRIFRVFKILKVAKYQAHIFKLIDMLNFQPTHSRIIVIVIGAMFLVHISACLYYLSARMNNFGNDTWVLQTDNIDTSIITSYCLSVYWAFQTLTTVGYGDFGCYNGYEILITCIWMFLGVAFYSFVVGSLTSTISSMNSQFENLSGKIKALDEFAIETGLDPVLHNQVKSFLMNNYLELFARVDEEALINELPPTIKEELFFF